MNAELAPKRGFPLSYLEGRLLFELYEAEGDRLVFADSKRYEDVCPHGCHLFDADAEYRMVWRETTGVAVECVLTRAEEDAMDRDLTFVEEPLVADEYARRPGYLRRVRVVSRYAYSPNDTLVFRNYRLSVAEGNGA